MQKGVSTWCFPEGMDYAAKFAMARDAGYETLEPAVDEEGELSLQSTKSDVLKIRHAAEKAGIGTPSLACALGWSYSLASPIASVQRKALQIQKKCLRIASWLGADTLLVVPGVVQGGHDPGAIRYDEAMERSREAIASLIPAAEKAGVCIGVENVWNRMLYMPLEFRDFVDGFQSDAVGVYFDVGNCLHWGFPEQFISILGPRIRKIHIKDFKLSIGNMDGFVPLLHGDVDFPAVVRELNHVEYTGPLTVEVGPTRFHPESTVYTSSLALDLILGRRGQLGTQR